MRPQSPYKASTVKTLISALLLAGLPAAGFAQADFFQEIEESDAIVHVDEKSRLAEKELERSLWNQLQNHRVVDADYGEIRAELAAADKALLDGTARLDGTAEKARVLPETVIGLHVDVERPAFLSERRRGDLGYADKDAGGGFVWTSSIEAPEASALRIHFTDFDLPKGAELYLYNDEGQVHGPYTARGPHGDGEFWSHTVFGEHAWLQVHSAQGELKGAAFTIESISHLGPEFELPARVRGYKADCSQNLDCIQNAECYDLDDILSTARRAVARYVYEDGGKSWTCTGGLLNDQDGSTRTPWFLTADHCIDNESSANSVEAYFQFQSPCGSCSGSYSDSVLGADLWAHSTTSDFALLELSELPSSWALMGWTNAKVLDDIGLQLYRISHPNSAPQSFSQHEVINASTTAYIVSDPVIGTTEGGSSGSPIFRSDRKVVGQNKGITYSTEDYDRCDGGLTFNTRDGALSAYWKSVKAYLTGGQKTAKMHVTDVAASYKTVSFPPFFTFYYPRLTVTVADQLGNAVARARVSVDFGGLSGIGQTNTDGTAVIDSPFQVTSQIPFTACVSDIDHDYFDTYDSASNALTCDSF